jgi:hypothetical protein
MVIKLDDRQIKEILYITEPNETLFPEKDFPAQEQKLRDFDWREVNRPKSKHEIFLWP